MVLHPLRQTDVLPYMHVGDEGGCIALSPPLFAKQTVILPPPHQPETLPYHHHPLGQAAILPHPGLLEYTLANLRFYFLPHRPTLCICASYSSLAKYPPLLTPLQAAILPSPARQAAMLPLVNLRFPPLLPLASRPLDLGRFDPWCRRLPDVYDAPRQALQCMLCSSLVSSLF